MQYYIIEVTYPNDPDKHYLTKISGYNQCFFTSKEPLVARLYGLTRSAMSSVKTMQKYAFKENKFIECKIRPVAIKFLDEDDNS